MRITTRLPLADGITRQIMLENNRGKNEKDRLGGRDLLPDEFRDRHQTRSINFVA